jgi:hypothetical protein
MTTTFATACTNLIAEYVIGPDGTGTAIFTFDDLEITAAEYDAIQIAALDRSLNGED